MPNPADLTLHPSVQLVILYICQIFMVAQMVRIRELRITIMSPKILRQVIPYSIYSILRGYLHIFLMRKETIFLVSLPGFLGSFS